MGSISDIDPPDEMADQALASAKPSDATVNGRLVSLRRLLTVCRELGAPLPEAKPLIKGEKVRPYRDTSGPGEDAVALLLDGMERTSFKGKRIMPL
jgi:hypothetical protein